ncbi:MAG: hypothetical protein WBD38_12730 [Candidatus Dormiibacterota bacterium]
MSPGKKASSGSPSPSAPRAKEAKAKPTTAEAIPAAAEPGTVSPATAGDVGAAPTPAEVVFTYSNAGQSVAIYWRGRQVKTVGGAVGAALRRKLAESDDATTQGLLARASGNFKRGTERTR